jgi:hypothetical protein
MMLRLRSAGLLAALVTSLACGRPALPPPEPPAPAPADDRVSLVFSAALEADARLESADSLYEPDALIVANGVNRYAPPRFAGLGPAGAVGIASSRVEVRSGMAWAQIEYRWISTSAGLAREGRATFVLVQNEQGAWRIRHAHSSSPDLEPAGDSGGVRAGGRP